MTIFSQIEAREREYKEAMAVIDANRPKVLHQPGPWSRDKYGTLIDANGQVVLLRSVAIVCSGSNVDQAEKNTDFVSMSTDMLEALERLLSQCDRLRLPGQPESDAEKTARAVSAKARGAA